MKRITILAISLVAALTTWAQTTLKGRVTDGVTHKPLAGASVSFGKNHGTVTDKDGLFTIDCSKASRIAVSYVGYEPYQHIVRNCNEQLDIALLPAGHSLEQV